MGVKDIRILFTDVDGVLTDNRIAMGDAGETVSFHVQDGVGHRLAQIAGLDVVWLSGRSSPSAARRAAGLGVPYLDGHLHKLPVAEKYCRERGLSLAQAAYVGDDLLDLPLLSACGWSACPADARPEVRRRVRYVARVPGGAGAFREILEALLRAQGRLERVQGKFLAFLERPDAKKRLPELQGSFGKERKRKSTAQDPG